MRAASAKAVSFFDASVFSDMIFVKLTNCRRESKKKKEKKKKRESYCCQLIDSSSIQNGQ